MVRGFCGDCGSPLSYEAQRFPNYIQLYIGAFDNPEQIKPQAHVHCGEKISWYEVADDLPKYQGSLVSKDKTWNE